MSIVLQTTPPLVDAVGRLSTLAEREAVRAAHLPPGFDGITEDIYATAAAIVQRGWMVQGEQFRAGRVVWYILPSFTASDSQRREWQAELYQLGNRSPFPAITCDSYRIEIVANG